MSIESNSTKEAKGKEKKCIPLDISKEYTAQAHLFQKELTSKVLPKYKLQNYKIVLQEEKTLGFRPIYRLLDKELATLQKYINKNLKKGFIRELQLLARFSILFVLKKDSSN